MYKSRIQSWGLDKKHKADEMQALVSMALERQSAGKRSRFRIRGRIVPLVEVQKYFRRRGITNLADVPAQSSKSSALADLTCSAAGNSPEPVRQDPPDQIESNINTEKGLSSLAVLGVVLSPDMSSIWPTLSSPAEYRQMEELLVAARDYFNPASTEFQQTIVQDDLVYRRGLQEFERYAHSAAVYADLADWKAAAIRYDKALARVPGILRTKQSLNFLVCLFVMLGCCANASRSALVPAMLRFASKAAAMVLPPRHPFCQLIHAISRNLPRVSNMIELAFTKAVDALFSENLGFDPRTRIVAYGLYETLFSRAKFFQARELIRESWRKEELLLGKRNTMTI